MSDDQYPHPSGEEPEGPSGAEPTGDASPSDVPGRPATRRSWWRPSRYSGRARIIGAAALVVVLAGAATAVLVARSGSDTPTPTALGHDPVPKPGKAIVGMPARCGVTRATLRDLVPHAYALDGGTGASDHCYWSHDDHGKGTERKLVVNFHLRGPIPQRGNSAGSPAVAVAMYDYGRVGVLGKDGLLAVHGLGDEAKISYDDHHHESDVTMRVRNAVVTVAYSGWNGSRALSGRRGFAGALHAAADVAKSLGAAHDPKIAHAVPVPPTAPITHTGKACKLIPAARVAELLDSDPDLVDPEDQSSTEQHGDDGAGDRDGAAKSTACEWTTGHAGALRVSVDRYPDVSPGSGTRAAKRDYRQRYVSVRAAEPISDDDERYFAPLRGLGEQAFAGYIEETLLARVVLRDRNVLIRVMYASAGDDHPLTREQAVGIVYTAATIAADALPERHRR